MDTIKAMEITVDTAIKDLEITTADTTKDSADSMDTVEALTSGFS